MAELFALRRIFLAFLPFFFLLCSTLKGQILSQDFNSLNNISEFENREEPDRGQVDRINLTPSNADTEIFSLGEKEGDQFLRINKQGRQMRHFGRDSGIEQEPTLIIAFDFELVSATRDGRIGAWFIGDDLYPNSRAPERVERWAELGIFANQEDNSFTLSNETAERSFKSNTSYTGKRRITLVANNSQDIAFYDDPTGGSTLIPDEALHIWVDDEQQEVSLQPYLGESAPHINAVKFMVWNTDFDAVYHLDNLVVGTLEEVPLPVELLDFRATQVDDHVELHWSTATEQNSSHFEIERSLDREQFSRLGQVNAAGNSHGLQAYIFTDEKADERLSGNLYYRLKMVDTDGSYEYSPVQLVPLSGSNEPLIEVFPNPFIDHLQVQVSEPKEQLLRIELRNQQGVKLISRQEKIIQGSNGIRFHMPEALAPGIYLLTIGTAANQKHFRLFKL